MIPGPQIIRQCSECAGLIIEDSIISGNTFGATLWTDGKQEAPMLPDQPWLVKCPHCQKLIWIDEQKEVARIPPFNQNKDYKKARSYDLPELEDYFSLLEEKNLNQEKELYVRIRAWWKGNDVRRGNKKNPSGLTKKERANLQTLFKVLDPVDDNQRILMAEIKRELEDFDGAVELLDKTFPDRFSHFVSTIRKLAKERNPFVAEIESEY